MTVSYSDRSFIRTLFYWRGSIWKYLLFSYLIFILMFTSINLTYIHLMDAEMKAAFESIVLVCEKWAHVIPIQFLLGFFVNSVFSRWWTQINCIAWPDKFLMLITANLQDIGDEENSKMTRLTFARYCNLVNVLVWKEIGVNVHKRFPTDDHLLRCGLMNEKELHLYKHADGTHGRWMRREERTSDSTHQRLVDELHAFRMQNQRLVIYDWISIPLVYTQLVTLATYGYFAFCLISRQHLDKSVVLASNSDFTFPVFTSLEFLFYMGWLKVGESLRCPFGSDDEDIDLNYVLDRNMHVSKQIVDELNTHEPQLVKDELWSKAHSHLPHTVASHKQICKHPVWSMTPPKLSEKQMGEFHPKHHHRHRSHSLAA